MRQPPVSPMVPLAMFTDYEHATIPQDAWYRVQYPNAPGVTGTPQTDRITIVDAPGDPLDPRRPPRAMRVELRPYDDLTIDGLADGDVNPSGNKSRAECYGMYPESASSKPWPQWPFYQNGGEWWIRFGVWLPTNWTYNDSWWLILCQLKQFYGGSPPLEIGIDSHQFKLEGNRNVFLAPATREVWHDFLLHIKFAPDITGGLEIWLDDQNVFPWWNGATMDTYNGAPDPTYIKQGIYRVTSWDVTHVAYFAPMRIGTSRAAVYS